MKQKQIEIIAEIAEHVGDMSLAKQMIELHPRMEQLINFSHGLLKDLNLDHGTVMVEDKFMKKPNLRSLNILSL